MTLLDAEVNTQYKIKNVRSSEGNMRRRLLDMGFAPSTVIYITGIAPLGKTVLVALRGTLIALREDAASLLELEAL